MILTMHGAPTTSNHHLYDHRKTASSNDRNNTTNTRYMMGSNSSTSSVAPRAINSTAYGSSRGSLRRQLPNGPGPLPDRFSLDKSRDDIRFVSSYHEKTDDKFLRTGYSDYNPSKYVSPQQKTSPMERKKSNDSGYSSTSSMNSKSYSSTNSLAARRTKSYSSLNDRLSSTMKGISMTDRFPSYNSSSSSRTLPNYSTKGDCSTGMSSRTKTLENVSQLDENANIYVSSSSRTGSDSESTKRHSSYFPVSTYSSSNISSSSRKGKALSDYGTDSRKEMITASTDSFRRSSKGSTSSSSPSTPSGRGCTDGLVGLRNLGNTCFMNSVLQCLSHSVVLTDYLLKGSHSKHINSKSSMKGKLIQAYAELIKSMWKPGNSDTAISPHSFKTQIQRFAPRFVGYNQQDAQEFLRFLLEGLHDDLNLVHDKPKYKVCEYNDSLNDSERAEKSWKHYLARDNSLITDFFVGQLKSTLKCRECGYNSVTFDPFWDLSLPIPRKSSSSYSSHIRPNVTIQECMDLFTKEELLDGDERPTCEKCKKKRKSTKQFTIQRFPKILVLHLKRFSGFGFRSKLQTAVEFPTDSRLNLRQFASDTADCESSLYGLYAVSNHSGTTYGGHYTAYCKHPTSREWNCFNDSSVDNIPVSRVGGSQAYILFYERVDCSSSL